MNLYVVGWNLEPALGASSLAALRQLTAVYPQLDPATLWQAAPHPGVFAAGMSTSDAAAAPRRYFAADDRHFGFFSGCPIDREGRFAANDARELLAHWDDLAGRLEGPFAIFRIGKSEPTVEMLNDFLGFEHIFTFEQGDTWIVSNSVGLIAQIVDAGGFDAPAVSQFLIMGWVGRDRTLRERVRVVPPAQVWRWFPGAGVPDRRTHYPRGALARLPSGGPRPERLPQLADDLVGQFQVVARTYGEVHCGLTGGRDSRVLAALLTRGGIPTRYYTTGVHGSEDFAIANKVAARLGVPHEIQLLTDAEVVADWEAGARRLIQQNDGMVNLLQVADLIRQPAQIEKLKFVFWGIGGETARGHLLDPMVLIRGRTWKSMRAFMDATLVDDGGGVINAEACREARAFLDEFADGAEDEGFAPLDGPSVYFLSERMRRWGGANGRKATPAGDRFSPFCTRAFVEAAFALSPSHRYCEHLHYGLVRLLTPDLLPIPFEGPARRSPRPMVNLAAWLLQSAGRRGRRFAGLRPDAPGPPRFSTFDHAAWLEAKREWWRSLALDRPTSAVWHFADRRVFEHLASPQTPASDRRRRMRTLYFMMTLFAYEEECERSRKGSGEMVKASVSKAMT